jgi:hypothetical protein
MNIMSIREISREQLRVPGATKIWFDKVKCALNQGGFRNIVIDTGSSQVFAEYIINNQSGQIIIKLNSLPKNETEIFFETIVDLRFKSFAKNINNEISEAFVTNIKDVIFSHDILNSFSWRLFIITFIILAALIIFELIVKMSAGPFLLLCGFIFPFLCIKLFKDQKFGKIYTLSFTIMPILLACLGIFIIVNSFMNVGIQTSQISNNTYTANTNNSFNYSPTSNSAGETATDKGIDNNDIDNKTTSSSKNDDNLIKGSSVTTIKQNLMQWGFKDASPDSVESSTDIFYTCSTTNGNTGATLNYSIIATNSLEVKSATFTVTNTQGVSTKSFESVAAGYLGYCATMPYDSAQPEKVKKWVEGNISKATVTGKAFTLIVGDAQFSLYGNGSGSRMLEVKKVKENG